jgi:Fur family ferric uptake transcriptional regulator
MEKILEEHGVKATANRLMIARALADAHRPLSMTELEDMLETIDKSNIFRALQTFKEAHLVHVLEDTGEGVRYEFCHSHTEGHDDDLHVHFYCENCHRTFCFEDTPIPAVETPEGYSVTGASYLVRGVCPECRKGNC